MAPQTQLGAEIIDTKYSLELPTESALNVTLSESQVVFREVCSGNSPTYLVSLISAKGPAIVTAKSTRQV